ncbi:MAG: NAD(P)-dependent alcohol dehydrogenase [Sedimentisphaerales bacterium]|nr:NAD(P)-dependent alcohol dehydrogenase [Sedimentisphaerales bacterium]
MKAIVYKEYGPPEVLHIEEVEKPVPKDNEILIKVHAAAVTSGDVRLRKADPFIARFFNGLTKPKNTILGVNFAGKIEETGNNVTQFKEGDEVFGSTVSGFGAYAEYVCISEDGVLAKKTANITFQEAAAVPFGALTSLHFLRKANIRQGQKVLIYGASGSLGTAAIQLAKYFGAEVTGLCSTANLELVKSLGADKVIDYTKEDFTKSNQAWDIIFDTVGKSPFFACVKKLNEKGIYLRSVHINMSSLVRGLWTNLTSNKKVIGGMAGESKEDLLFINELIESEKYKPVIDKSYSFEQIAQAHEYVDKGHKKGNVVITIE